MSEKNKIIEKVKIDGRKRYFLPILFNELIFFWERGYICHPKILNTLVKRTHPDYETCQIVDFEQIELTSRYPVKFEVLLEFAGYNESVNSVITSNWITPFLSVKNIFIDNKEDKDILIRLLRATNKGFNDKDYRIEVNNFNELYINGVEKEIAYRDAWVLKDGKITLAEGIDKEYDINGKKFISFRNLMQEKARTLGSVSSLNTPQMSRHLIGKMIGFLRSFLTPIIISRVGFMTKNKKWYIPEERYNLATGEAEMGTYIRTLKELAAVFKYGGQNLRHMNKETKQAFFRTFFEIGVVMLLTYANQLLFGWDPEDPDRYKKMKKRSGSLPLPWIDNNKGGDFKLNGWLANHAVYLLLKIRTENEAFLPLPGFGLDDYSRLINIDAAAVFGSTIVNYTKIVNNLVQAAGDKKSAYYTRTVGPYDFQQKGSLKALNFLAKSFGFSGKFVDPTMATKSLIDVLNKLGGGSSGGSNTKDNNENNSGTYLMR